MARLRANFVRGTITNNPLAIGDTTLTSASLASFPTVVSPDTAIIILDPGAAAPEIVTVTAHSAAATSATITRGSESSTARAHIQGTAWAHGAVAADFPTNAFPTGQIADLDLLYGVASTDSYAALAAGSALKFLRINAAGTGLEWVEVPTIISADAYEWGSKVANRYTANFNVSEIWAQALGDLLDWGWRINTASAPPAVTTGRTGDLDSASDAGESLTSITTDTYFIASPPVIGGRGLIEGISQAIGTRPTVITAWVVFRFTSTTDSADTSGIGIGNDADAILSGAGRGFFITTGATNFELWDGSAATDLGVAVDTDLHVLEIELTLSGATYRVLLDGTQRKASAAVATDVWPMAINAYRGASGTTIQMYSCGVNYD